MISFNRVTVDGDTSTNDTVVALASGVSGVRVSPGTTASAWYLKGLTQLCRTLAIMIARDGEGAKKLVMIEVQGAGKPADAERIARAIANSPLVKTAIAGSDPNWGRILCAAGYSGAVFDPNKVDIRINGLLVCRSGLDSGFDEASAREELDRKEVTLRLDLHQGRASAQHLDLRPDPRLHHHQRLVSNLRRGPRRTGRPRQDSGKGEPRQSLAGRHGSTSPREPPPVCYNYSSFERRPARLPGQAFTDTAPHPRKKDLMSGIIGYIGNKRVVPVLLEGLQRLQYRGYDSAGIAVIQGDNLQVRRAPGKLHNLEEVVRLNPVDGTYGVGHTRWATHGAPTEKNAHPHRDCTGTVVVVHNGIIENYLELKKELEAEGHKFATEVDTEVIAHLVEKYLDGGTGQAGASNRLEEAVRSAVHQLRGVFALAIISTRDLNKIIAVREGPPAVIGLGKDEYFVASDVPAILYHTRDLLFLADHDMAVLTPNGVKLTDFDGRPCRAACSTSPGIPSLPRRAASSISP